MRKKTLRQKCRFLFTVHTQMYVYRCTWESSTTLAGLHCRSVFTCLLVATYCKFEISVFKYFTKIDLVHQAGYEGYCQVQCWRPGAKLKHAWQLLVCTLLTINGRLLTGSTNEPVLHGMNSTHKRQKSGSQFRRKAQSMHVQLHQLL